jgi:hypothetical protein
MNDFVKPSKISMADLDKVREVVFEQKPQDTSVVSAESIFGLPKYYATHSNVTNKQEK